MAPKVATIEIGTATAGISGGAAAGRRNRKITRTTSPMVSNRVTCTS